MFLYIPAPWILWVVGLKNNKYQRYVHRPHAVLSKTWGDCPNGKSTEASQNGTFSGQHPEKKQYIYIYIYIYTYRGFLKLGYPESSILFLDFPWNNPSIFGYPHLWNPPYIYIYINPLGTIFSKKLYAEHTGFQGWPTFEAQKFEDKEN